jgi:hypothetical protein
VLFDEYYSGSAIFYNGSYAALKYASKEWQEIYLVIGGADPWRQPPQNYVNYAHGDPQIKGIMVFVWGTNRSPDSDYGKGVEENGTELTWCLAAVDLLGRNPTACNAVVK